MQDARFIRRNAIIAVVACLLLAAWSAYHLWRLEQYGVAVSVHAVPALMYRWLGFWPAVLVFPLIALVAGLEAVMRYRKARRREATPAR
jgi:hypothetical protein